MDTCSIYKSHSACCSASLCTCTALVCVASLSVCFPVNDRPSSNLPSTCPASIAPHNFNCQFTKCVSVTIKWSIDWASFWLLTLPSYAPYPSCVDTDLALYLYCFVALYQYPCIHLCVLKQTKWACYRGSGVAWGKFLGYLCWTWHWCSHPAPWREHSYNML